MCFEHFSRLAELTAYIEDTFQDQSLILYRGQPQDLPLCPGIARNELTYGELLDAEREMLAMFERHSIPFLESAPPTRWDWIALAQHHQLPTRLLDWSLNPLTALWFAVQEPPIDGKDGVLWILAPEDEDEATDEEKQRLEFSRYSLFSPSHVSLRMPAQGSWFTVHKTLAQEPYFEPLERSSEFSSKLTKVRIPADKFAHFRFNLNKFGINHASVMPGLDGLGRYIGRDRFYLSDELDPNRVRPRRCRDC